MNEESGSEVHVEHDELNNEDGLKIESEDLNEEIAPNETPPEVKASFNDDTPEVKDLSIFQLLIFFHHTLLTLSAHFLCSNI